MATLAVVSALGLRAEEAPLWLRYPAVSPDGEAIAFTFKGDIYTVPFGGGRALQITSNAAHDTQPMWSPDSKKILFSSNREGSFDLFTVSAQGGVPQRLTSHSGAEYPEAYTADAIYFKANVMPDVKDIQFPSRSFPQIYKIGVDGGRPELFSSLAMEDLAFDASEQRVLYTDIKGYEDPWRKHHTSSIARDVWMAELGEENQYKKLTSFKGEDRNAVWAGESAMYYLSEEDGSFNVYKRDLSSGSSAQVTKFKEHPVRFLSIDKGGDLCFGYDGQIYTMKQGAEPALVDVQIISDKIDKDVVYQTLRSGATAVAVSPNEKEVAFVVRGDVFVASSDYGTTRRVTNTAQQERNIDFSPDGRSIVYSAERGETWGIYQSTIKREEDKSFTYAVELEEEALVDGGTTSFQPKYSPDGKMVAFLENRTTLKVIDLKSKKITTALDGKFNYSYADGDISFSWSPDSEWLLVDYIGVGGWNNTDVALVKADGEKVVNLTESGYTDGGAKWVLEGKAMIWSSDRAGYRSHGSWGSHRDTYIMFFDQEAYDKFRMNKEELSLAELSKSKKEKKEDEKEEEKKKEDEEKSKEGESPEPEKVKSLEFDLEGRKDRVMRLTINSSNQADAVLTPKGDKLYYLAAFEGGYDLWEMDIKERRAQLLIKGVGAGGLMLDKSGSNLYLASGGQLKKIAVAGRSIKTLPYAAEFEYKPQQEREYIFNHVWRQVDDKFYDPTIHGIDWEGYKSDYAKFLPYINNDFDFAEMLSEMLGELNGSHTGARYYAWGGVPTVAELGAFYDNDYTGEGVKIAEVLKGGPLAKSGLEIEPGCIIKKIDGKEIVQGADFYPMLAGKIGKTVTLTVTNAKGKGEFEQKVKPISSGAQSELLYKRWVENNRKRVEELSGGRVGYVHIKGMNSDSFREVYSDLLGRDRNKEAVIVDTRHNGGGWLHDDLVTLLSGKEYQQFAPRGQYIGSDPFNKWLKPSCVLVCEDNYSNAHGFPWVYKKLGIGKLIGTSVPGTMTAVWWESQINPSIVFGIPQVGVRDMEGNYLENEDLMPDIEVFNSPESQLKGEDEQLKRAVEHMLETIKK